MTPCQIVLLVLSVGIGLSAALAFAWLIQRNTGNSGWIDAIWSFSVGAAGIVLSLAPVAGHDAPSARQWAVAGLVGLWSLRLGSAIVRRTWGGVDDPRYAALKQEWGADFPRRLFWFLQTQAAAAFLLALSVFVAAQNPAQGLGLADYAAMAVLLAAVAGEGWADAQLQSFKADPANAGKVCEAGLWGYSRHPNYFFEWLGWCAYPLFAIDLSFAYPWGWAALAGPAFMYWLLVHVSGIPHLEAHMVRSRGVAFRAYQARVNAFFPGPRGIP